MSGSEMFAALVHAGAVIAFGRFFLYREPQYTSPSWLALVGIAFNVVGLGIAIS